MHGIFDVLSAKKREAPWKTFIWRMTYPTSTTNRKFKAMVKRQDFKALEGLRNTKHWFNAYVEDMVENSYKESGIQILDYSSLVLDRMDIQWFYWNQTNIMYNSLHRLQDEMFWKPLWVTFDEILKTTMC